MLPPGFRPIVRTTFSVAGDVASFDQAGFRSALLSQFSEAEDVTLTVTPGSVNVVATLIMRSRASAESAANRIATTPTSTMQSNWFGSVNGGAGVVIENTPSATTTVAVLSPPPPKPPPPPRPPPPAPPPLAESPAPPVTTSGASPQQEEGLSGRSVLSVAADISFIVVGVLVTLTVACCSVYLMRRRARRAEEQRRQKEIDEARLEALATARAEARAELQAALESLRSSPMANCPAARGGGALPLDYTSPSPLGSIDPSQMQTPWTVDDGRPPSRRPSSRKQVIRRSGPPQQPEDELGLAEWLEQAAFCSDTVLPTNYDEPSVEPDEEQPPPQTQSTVVHTDRPLSPYGELASPRPPHVESITLPRPPHRSQGLSRARALSQRVPSGFQGVQHQSSVREAARRWEGGAVSDRPRIISEERTTERVNYAQPPPSARGYTRREGGGYETYFV